DFVEDEAKAVFDDLIRRFHAIRNLFVAQSPAQQHAYPALFRIELSRESPADRLPSSALCACRIAGRARFSRRRPG
ncbi:MAG TPA: hypothetical protein VK638_50310, partial [Edaphobacter sp.]|nr:hypothetical protein [Edaphobacter sp.]